MRFIDADAFDRKLANAEFTAALNHADDNDRPFEHEAMYYSTQSFRDVMSYQPTIDAIPVEWLNQKYAENDPNTHEEDYDYYLWNAIAYILTLWKEEQEDSK